MLNIGLDDTLTNTVWHLTLSGVNNIVVRRVFSKIQRKDMAKTFIHGKQTFDNTIVPLLWSNLAQSDVSAKTSVIRT